LNIILAKSNEVKFWFGHLAIRRATISMINRGKLDSRRAERRSGVLEQEPHQSSSVHSGWVS